MVSPVDGPPPSRSASARIGAALRLERRRLQAGCRDLLRRPRPPLPAPPDGFPTMGTSGYGTLCLALAVVTLVELPALHVLLHARGAGPAVHVAIAAAHVYGVLWLLGDRRLLATSCHRLTGSGLEIALGLRCRGLVPYDAIAEVLHPAAADARPAPPGRRRRRSPLTWPITPLEVPNVTLVLRRPVGLAGALGLRQARRLHLFVDHPAELARALAGRLG